MRYVDNYYKWLKDNTFTIPLENGYHRLQFPFLNHNNDYIELFAKENSDGSYMLTDDGATISDLRLSGLTFTDKRKHILNDLLFSFGVTKDEDMALSITAVKEEFPQKKHMLIQCIAKVSDMFMLNSSNVKSLFTEDVSAYLDAHAIRYISDVTFTGRSSFQTQFDYAIPKSNASPERLVKAINSLDRTSSKVLIFGWADTRVVRNKDTKLYTFINDTDREINETLIAGLRNYDIIPIKWTQREKYISDLVS